MFGFHQVGVPEEDNWLGRLASFLPGADAMSSKDRMALVSQGLLAMGAGILKNNNGHRGKAGPAIGAGITEGLLAMNKGADNLSERKQREAFLLAQNGDPAQFRAMDMAARAAGYEPGTEGYKDYFRRANGELPRASSAAYGYQIVEGPDGRPQLVVTDPRNPMASPLGASGQPMLQGPGYTIDPSLPPEVQAAIQQAEASGQPLPPNIDLAPAIPRRRAPGPNPFVGRRPEDEAAATEAAKLGVQLQALPAELGMRTNAAIQQAAGTAQAQANVERETAAPKLAAKARVEVDRADRVMKAVDRAITGADWASTGAVGKVLSGVPMTDAYDLRETMKEIRSNIGFRELQQMRDNSPTGGALGQTAVQELEMLQSTMGSLDQAQSREQFVSTLQRIRESMARWKQIQQQIIGGDASDRAPGSMQPGHMEDGYRFKGGDPADPRNWERL